jgi:hypothetical protein
MIAFGTRSPCKFPREVESEIQSIYGRIKLSRLSEGVLYYAIENANELHVSAIVETLGHEGFQVTLVHDTRVKELLPRQSLADEDCAVIRVEWGARQVHKLWPKLKFRDPISLYQMRQPLTILASMRIAAALATLVFILGSFLYLLLTGDPKVPDVFLTCGLGCFLLLCLVVFLHHD